MRKITFLFGLIPLFCLAQNSLPKTVSLNTGWQFTQTGKNEWRNARIPGSVQSNLIRHGVLPKPFYGANEKKIQWVEDKNWDFKKTFSVTAQQLQYDDANLFLEGLDTHADVFLNGAKILHAQNMFIGYKIPVKKLLREGKNKLYIRFYSPVQHLMPAQESSGFEYPADNDHRTEKLSIYSRKAPYHFGWDWGIRIVQMGIWKPVLLTFYDKARIDDFYVEQISVSEKKAKINNQIEVYSVEKKSIRIDVNIDYSLNGIDKQSIEKEITLNPGKNKVTIPVEIINPKRWMPVGWGKQYLYDFTAKLSINGQTIAQKSQKIGLRTVKLMQNDDEYGQSFYFEVNNIPLYAKGANYIPGETFTAQQDSAYYQQLFDNITAANMNFVRVWGGGTYESNYFYELADKKGILVWQDFIFACTTYPHDNAFLENVREEVIYNIKRIRNHASHALWCGNNEIEEGLKYWGWENRVPKFAMKQFKEGYDKIFRELLPDIVTTLDMRKNYIHGSPLIANWGRPQLFGIGDTHDWGLWYGQLPFEELNNRKTRFSSEFGFQSFPEMKTIRTFAPENQWSLESEVMKIHQKASTGNSSIKQYMKMYYRMPDNFENFVYVGLVMQGEGMKNVIEGYRRSRPYNMGTLYWQLNDSWPVVSWAGIDYYNNWKPLHYKVREVYAPLALGSELNNNQLSLFTLSDKLEDVNNLQLSVKVIDFNGNVLRQLKKNVSVKANSSQKVSTYTVSDLVSEAQKSHTAIDTRLINARGKEIARKTIYFYYPHKLDLPEISIQKQVRYADGRYTVTLWSKKLAKNVFIEIPTLGAQFTDNFFDLLPGEKRKIEITSPALKASERTPITIKHLRETY